MVPLWGKAVLVFSCHSQEAVAGAMCSRGEKKFGDWQAVEKQEQAQGEGPDSQSFSAEMWTMTGAEHTEQQLFSVLWK